MKIFSPDEPLSGGGENRKTEWREALTRAIEELPQREKLVLALYYKEELTLKEIGRVLKVSTARVSQIHARTLRLLKENLRKSGFLDS